MKLLLDDENSCLCDTPLFSRFNSLLLSPHDRNLSSTPHGISFLFQVPILCLSWNFEGPSTLFSSVCPGRYRVSFYEFLLPSIAGFSCNRVICAFSPSGPFLNQKSLIAPLLRSKHPVRSSLSIFQYHQSLFLYRHLRRRKMPILWHVDSWGSVESLKATHGVTASK